MGLSIRQIAYKGRSQTHLEISNGQIPGPGECRGENGNGGAPPGQDSWGLALVDSERVTKGRVGAGRPAALELDYLSRSLVAV